MKGILLVLFLQAYCQVNIAMLDGEQVNIYTNGKLNETFNDTTLQNKMYCASGNIYIVERTRSENGNPLVILAPGLSVNQSIRIEAGPNSRPQPVIISQTFDNVTLDLDCSPFPSDYDYYNHIKISIAGYNFSFMLDCDEGERHKRFEFGYMIIALIDSIIIISVALHSRIWSYSIKGREFGVKTTWKWILPTIILAAGGVILATSLNIFDTSLAIFGSIVAGFSLIVCLNEVLYLSKKLRKKVFKIVRMCDLISIPLGLAIVITLEFTTKDFITNNLLAIAITVAGIKIFKFISLRDAVVCCGLIMAVESITALVFHYVSPQRSYNDVFGRQLHSPFFLQVPSLRNSLYKKCSWLAVSDVVFPGVAIAYLRRYEKAREGKFTYLVVSNVAFCVSTFIWMFIEAVYGHTLPFSLITNPITFIVIVLLGKYMTELRVLWNGTFEDPEYKDNEEYQKVAVEKGTDSMDSSGLMDGIRASKFQD